MASLSRSLSLPTRLKRKTSELEDLILTRLPQSSFQKGDVALGKDVIEHPYHRHPLFLSTYVKENVDQKDLCYLCEIYFTWGTPTYSCSECGDFSHKWCAVLPLRITNLLHPKHLLGLSDIKDSKCCKCGEDISGGSSMGYTCFVPHDDYDNFQLHVKCAIQDIPISIESTSTSSLSRSLSFPLDWKQNSPIRFSDPRKLQNVSLIISSFAKFQNYLEAAKIRHFSHKHPLVLMKYFTEYDSKDCILCGMELLPDVLSYGCAECCFFLHESCPKKLPQNIRTTLHPAHLLDLTSLKTKTVTCICDKEISGGIGYFCGVCDFSLHCECASTHIFEDHKEHKFHYLKASMFTCDACGVRENEERMACLCTGCHLQVHKKCSYSFPRKVIQRRHDHKLRLTYFFESTDVDFADRMCMICFNKINNVYCMYQCTKYNCAYITHVTCSTTRNIIIYEEESDDSESLGIEEFIPSTEDTEEQQQVEFFKHPHDLVFITNLISDESGTYEICDACVRPIICVPFYKCVQDGCSFRLHKQCFELPSEIQHPLHAHPLKLELPWENDYCYYNLFMVKCYGCDIRCNGFVYGCRDCGFWMDVCCSLLSDTLKHDSHACTLSLVDYELVHDRDKAKCSACECESPSLCKYTCERCNFHLDLGCALLPKTVPHECPRHNWKPNYPLKLMYGAIKDASGIYFCDLCEEPRGEEDWFYYCEDCKWSNHPHCVLGKVQLKYGKTYQFYRGHDHEVKFVKEPERESSCDHCGKPCKIQINVDNARLICENPQLCSAFFCDECKIHIHVDCAQLLCNTIGCCGFRDIIHEI